MFILETLNQPFIFVQFILIGVCCGVFFDVKRYIIFLCNKSQIVNFATGIICGFISGTVFFYHLFLINYFEFRAYILIAFFIGIIIERIIIGNLLAKIASLCYNKFENKLKVAKAKIGKKLERKRGKKIN